VLVYSPVSFNHAPATSRLLGHAKGNKLSPFSRLFIIYLFYFIFISFDVRDYKTRSIQTEQGL
jgi:hypothetical protein